MKISNLSHFTALLGLALSTSALGADFASVCSRSNPIKANLVQQLNKTCDQISAEDLATITRIAVVNANIRTYNPSDFANLPNLQILNLNRNKFESLPPQAFVNLPSLQTIVIIDVPLIKLPDDFLVGNDKIENVIVYKNDFGYIPSHILARIEDLPNLKVLQLTAALSGDEKTELTTLFPQGGPVDLSFPTE